jgi:hypothetical protein
MTSLTDADGLRVLEFLRSLYAPCSMEAFPAQIMADVPGVIGTEISGFVSFSTREVALPCISPHYVTLPQIVTFPDPAIGVAATAFTAQPENFFSHPLPINYLQTLDGQARAISDFLSESEFHCQEPSYKRFLEHFGIQDQMGIYIALPYALKTSSTIDSFHRQQEHVCLLISRDRRNFTDRDRLVLNLIRPHLKQAYENVVAFNQLQHQLTQRHQATEQAALIALSTDGNVEWMTQRAGTLLHDYFPPSKAHISFPDLLQHWVKHQRLEQTQANKIPDPPSPLCIEHH